MLSIKITDFAVESLNRINVELKGTLASERPWLRSQGRRRSKGKIGGASRMQTFQPPALSGSRRAFVMPAFMIAMAVAAFWFAATMSAIACSVVILSAFSTSMFILALGRSMAVFATVIVLGDL